MGKHNHNYQKSLEQVMHEKLVGMQAFGQSKRADQLAGCTVPRIYSFRTYKTYRQQAGYFCDWIKANHPNVTSMKKAEKLVPEWLQNQVDRGLSSYTVQTSQAAMSKIFSISSNDPHRFQAPSRCRADITRSRGFSAGDSHFSETKNSDLINFCRGTGLRRSEIEQIRGRDLITRSEIKERIEILEMKESLSEGEKNELRTLHNTDLFTEDHYIHIVSGKGGKERYVPIIGDHKNEIIDRMRYVGTDEKVWKTVHQNCDVHGYRAEYAASVYAEYARDTSTLSQSDLYICRKDRAGLQLDRSAMEIASKALGHNRVSVIAGNYAHLIH